MTHFELSPLNQDLHDALVHKIKLKTKPQGALGQLEAIALQVGCIQQTLTPTLINPAMLVFAGDHGIAQSGVSPYPQAVTAQMVLNFLAGGVAINVFCRQVGMQLLVIDAGVNHTFTNEMDLIPAKMGLGTANFLHTPAMRPDICNASIAKGADIAKKQLSRGSNVLGIGEMGIGNTSSASCLMSVLTSVPIAQCVGRGTGLDDVGLANKTLILSQAIAYHKLNADDPYLVLATFGGFEIAMMVGAMLAAAEQKAVLMIDGFIATAAILVASKIQPMILEYCIFAHRSDERPHQALLDYLRVKPLLDIGLRLGEGTGVALAYPLVQGAVNFLNEMASFESAGISKRVDA
jgi:nicotinate-nucleotide--dimethylbenzimidazole phosphoribosyltransferase